MVPCRRMASTTAVTSASPRRRRPIASGVIFARMRWNWCCASHSNGTVPRPKARVNSAPLRGGSGEQRGSEHQIERAAGQERREQPHRGGATVGGEFAGLETGAGGEAVEDGRTRDLLVETEAP